MTSEESSEDITTNSPIKLQPTELTFLKASLTHADTANLTMINTSDDLLSFKIKTTRPKRYCVRPNIGLIQPKKQVDIVVILNLQKDPPDDSKQRDKFQIQSIVVKTPLPSDDTQALKKFWDNVSKNEKDKIMKQKLRSTFTIPLKAKKELTSSDSKKQLSVEPPATAIADSQSANESEPAHKSEPVAESVLESVSSQEPAPDVLSKSTSEASSLTSSSVNKLEQQPSQVVVTNEEGLRKRLTSATVTSETTRQYKTSTSSVDAIVTAPPSQLPLITLLIGIIVGVLLAKLFL